METIPLHPKQRYERRNDKSPRGLGLRGQLLRLRLRNVRFIYNTTVPRTSGPGISNQTIFLETEVQSITKYILLNKVVLFVKPDEKAFVAFGMLLMTAPAHADITSRMSTSVQYNQDAWWNLTRTNRKYNTICSVSRTNIDVTTFGGMTDIDDDGSRYSRDKKVMM